MKERIYVLALAALAVLLNACAGSPQTPREARQPGAVVPSGIQRDKVVIDWSGANLGRQIPEWVGWVGDGDPDDLLSTLPRVSGKKTIAVSSEGTDLDLLRVWVNLQAQGNAATMIKTMVSNEAGGAAEGGTEVKKFAATQFINAIAEAEISGLGRELDFWVKERSISTNKESYTYYLVFGITEENYNFLIERALGKVQVQNQEQREMLDEIKDRAKKLRFGVAGDTGGAS
jgi:hypothetical protein